MPSSLTLPALRVASLSRSTLSSQHVLRVLLAACVAGTALLGVGACGGSAADRLEEARQLHEVERYDESIPLLEALLDRNPDDRELNHLYGVALLATGQPALAIWPLGRAAESPDRTLEDDLLLGRAHVDGGSAEDALAVAARLIEKAPTLLEARRLRIDANLAASRPEDALSDVDFVLEHLPDDPSALITRASLLLALERSGAAEAAIAAASEVMATSSAPEAWAARFCAVRASFVFERGEDGHVERAGEAWSACAGEFPTDSLVVAESVAFFDMQGELERSLAVIQRAVEEAPQRSDYRIALGRRLDAMGREEEAEKVLRAAAGASSGPEVWFALSEYHADREAFAEAVDAMERGLARLPQPTPRVRLLYADLLVRAGAFEAAEGAIEMIERPELQSLMRGRLALGRGDARRALALLSDGIRLWPSNSVARELAGEAALRLGDYERAIAEYTEAVRSDPKNWEALQQLAMLHEAMGRVGPMVQLANLHVRANRRDPRGYRLLARIGIWSGQDAVARNAIRELRKLPGQRESAAVWDATLRAKRDPAAAVEFIARTQLDLTHPRSADLLGVLLENLAKLSRHGEAIARAEAARAAHPKFARFHELYAQAQKAAGRPRAEVDESPEPALELAPGR